MKFDVLHNFISPVTGRILCDPTYVLVGDSNGIAMPSSILVDILDASFVIGSPNASLPNAQVLDALADGYLYTTEGVVSTTPTVIPFLSENKLWIGDATNTPTEYSNITIDNLPGLGQTIVPDPIGGGFVGQIWEGNNLGRPEISNRLGAIFADVALLNLRFLTVHFVLNEGNALLRLAMPNSQFLEDLAPGGIAKVEATGQISIAVAGTDYLDVGAPPPGDGVIPILEPGPYPPNPKLIYPSTIHIIGTDDVIGINSLSGNILSAKNAVTSDDIMVSKRDMQTRKLILFDYNEAPRYTNYVSLDGPALLAAPIGWTMPDQQGIAGQVLTNTDGTILAFRNVLPAGLKNNVLAQGVDGGNQPIIINAALTKNNLWLGGNDDLPAISPNIVLENLPPLAQDKLWIGDINDRPVEQSNITLKQLPPLQQNYLWIGDAGGRPAESLQIDLINLPDLPNNKLWLGDAGNAAQEVSNILIGNLPDLAQDSLWIGGAGNRPVEQTNITVFNLPPLAENHLWTGNAEGFPVESANITLSALPDLAQGKLWRGDAFNRPEEVDGDELGNVSGPEPAFSIDGNVAIWDGATGRKIKDSEFSIAELEALAEEAAASAEEAATSAAEALASAEEATAAAGEATAAAGDASISAAAAASSAVTAGLEAISASISSGNASGYADDAEASANSSASSAGAAAGFLNTLLTTKLTLTGDVTASELIKNPIVTTFKQNPVFLGAESLTLPGGTTAQRPGAPTAGMIRYNNTILNSELYNGSSWITAGTGNGTVTSITAGTGLSGGTITTSGTIALANTAVSPGSYTYGNFTVNNQGQLTAASNGATPLLVSNNLSDLANAATARTNLGLTNISTQTVTQNSILIGGNANSIVSTALTNGQLLIGSTGNAPVAAVPTNGTNITWTTGAGSLTANLSGPVSLANGGTNANLTASNGGIFYSTATSGAILSGTATANKVLLSGLSSAPSWSNATYPATTTINQILYSSAANVISGLATANNGVLITSAAGIPSISNTLTTIVQGNITSVGTVTSGTWNASTITVPYGGTGLASATAYGVLCGGITSTSALQYVSGLGTAGQVLTSQGAGALPIWATKAFCSIIMSGNLTATLITVANTFVKVAGITTSAASNLFTATSNRATYTGNTAMNVRVDINFMYYHTGSGSTIDKFTIFKNGVAINAYVATPLISPGNNILTPMGLNAIIPMVTNDYLEVFATTTIVPVSIIVASLNFTISEL